MSRRLKKTPIIDVKSAEEVSEAITVNLPTIAPSSSEVDFAKSFEEEDSFLDAKKAEGIRKLKIQNSILESQLTKLNNDNRARVSVSKQIFLIVICWLAAVILVMVLTGIGLFTFSDKVLIALLTTSSVNVIGLLVIVANYLFNKTKST